MASTKPTRVDDAAARVDVGSVNMGKLYKPGWTVRIVDFLLELAAVFVLGLLLDRFFAVGWLLDYVFPGGGDRGVLKTGLAADAWYIAARAAAPLVAIIPGWVVVHLFGKREIPPYIMGIRQTGLPPPEAKYPQDTRYFEALAADEDAPADHRVIAAGNAAALEVKLARYPWYGRRLLRRTLDEAIALYGQEARQTAQTGQTDQAQQTAEADRSVETAANLFRLQMAVAVVNLLVTVAILIVAGALLAWFVRGDTGRGLLGWGPTAAAAYLVYQIVYAVAAFFITVLNYFVLRGRDLAPGYLRTLREARFPPPGHSYPRTQEYLEAVLRDEEAPLEIRMRAARHFAAYLGRAGPRPSVREARAMDEAVWRFGQETDRARRAEWAEWEKKWEEKEDEEG